jgi:chromosome partitioning protein
LSAALAERGEKVLNVDIDQQGATTISLGFDPDSFEQTTYHVLLKKIPLEEIIVSTSIPGVDLAPANLDLAGIEAAKRDTGWERVLKEVLVPLSKYDYVLLDCPTFLGRTTMNALVAADLILIPVQCEYLAFRALKLLSRIIATVRHKANPTIKVKILRTMHDTRTGLSKDVLQRVEEIGRRTVFSTVIDRAVNIGYAAVAGQSIFQYDGNSKSASAYRQLAQEVITYAETTEN